MYILKVGGGNYFSHFKNGKIRLSPKVSGALIFLTEVEVDLVERILEEEGRGFHRLKVVLEGDVIREGDLFRAKYSNGKDAIFCCIGVEMREEGLLVSGYDVRSRELKTVFFNESEIIERWKKLW